MTAEEFPAALARAGWRLYRTSDGRLRTCTHPPGHPAVAAAGVAAARALPGEPAVRESLGLAADDFRVVLAALNCDCSDARLRMCELPARLWRRAAAVRGRLEGLA